MYKRVLRLCLQFNSFAYKRPLINVNIRRNNSTENPFMRTFRIISNDVKDVIFMRERVLPLPTHCDILIVGGGCMGSSIAYWLKKRALEGLSIVVVEKDPSVMLSNNSLEKLKYEQCTTVLSVGGMRQQFSLKENIELSLASAEFLRNIKHHLSVDGLEPPDVQFQPAGYIFLATEKSAHILEENVKLQKSLGAKIDLLSSEQLKTRFPWMKTDDIALGTHGLENEGWFDPYLFLFALKNKATNLGVEYLSGEVSKFILKESSNLIALNDTKKNFLVNDAVIKLADGTDHNIHFSKLVIAAGGMSGEIGKMIGMGSDSDSLPLPVEPRKRYVFNIHCPDGPGVLCPMVIDPSGAYFRREGLGGHYLCGISPPDDEEPENNNLDVDYSYFEEKVWPIIANRCPAFENAKLKSAWAGFYDFNKFDENAFIGHHPDYFNVYLATGFSGHGIQQAPAIGRALMELIIDGGYQTIDLQRLDYMRYIKNEPLYESNIV